jgi:hypothetical protein
MELGRFMGLYVIIPASVLFALSFFILVVIKKNAKELQRIGYAAVALLWLAVALLLGSGINILTTGKYPFRRTTHMLSSAYATGRCAKMQAEMGKSGMQCPMMQQKGQAAAPAEQQKDAGCH